MRKLVVEELAHNDINNENDDSHWGLEWVDSDNEVGKDDNDLYKKWVDADLENKKIQMGVEQWLSFNHSEKQQYSDIEDADSMEEVEVFEGRKKLRRKWSSKGSEQRTWNK